MRKKEKKERKLELNLSGNPTGRSPSFPEKRFLKCVEVKVIRTMSSVMCWNIQITKKNLGLLTSVIYFLCCEIELFIHSCSIERKQTITDHCIKYCKALGITNNGQIWGTCILIKNGSKIRKKGFFSFVSFWHGPPWDIKHYERE